MDKSLDYLKGIIDESAVFSGHEHYKHDLQLQTVTVDSIIANSYVSKSWVFATPGTTSESRRLFLSRLKTKSYLHWLKKSLKAMYGMTDELTQDNWDEYSQRIAFAHTKPGLSREIFEESCRFVGVVQDSYWNPGEKNLFDHFYPAFRINSFVYGFNEKARDHNGNNARLLYGIETREIDEYTAKVKEVIVRKKEDGVVALKCALAYDRSLRFNEVDAREAEKALKARNPTDEEIRSFGDYVFHSICAAAGDLSLPMQVHTGLGKLDGSDPMNFETIVRKYPNVEFVLLHGGFPWIDSISGLLHNYPNVFVDLVWLPLISPAAATHALHQWLEVANSDDRILWGGDAHTPEESYGAVLAFKEVLWRVLSEKLQSGYIDLDSAVEIAQGICRRNAKALYRR